MAEDAQDLQDARAPVRPVWTGTITFGLVSIPVDLMSSIRPRHTAMKLVDTEGHALGRQYRCSKDNRKLGQDDLIRGYPTADGKFVEITDAEFASAAPEMSGDIELRSFVPLDQIPPMYFQRSYFLAPAGKSVKAYYLLAQTMERARRVGIGSFVMRGREYLVAIVPDRGVLRADTLRYADEIRTAESVDLPKRAKPSQSKVAQFARAVDALRHDKLVVAELQDEEAQALAALVKKHADDTDRLIHTSLAQSESASGDEEGGGNVIDLMERLRASLSKTTNVSLAGAGEPISLAERRAARARKQAESSDAKPSDARRAPKRRRTRKR